MRQLEQDGSGQCTLADSEGGAGSLGTYDAVVLADAMTGRSGKGFDRRRACDFATLLAYCHKLMLLDPEQNRRPV